MSYRGHSKYDLIIAGTIIVLTLVISRLNLFEDRPDRANGKELFTPLLHETGKAIVVQKYLDKNHHSYPTIDLIFNNSIERYYDLTWDFGLYNYIEVSDSIITVDYGEKLIVRRNKKDSIFNLGK